VRSPISLAELIFSSVKLNGAGSAKISAHAHAHVRARENLCVLRTYNLLQRMIRKHKKTFVHIDAAVSTTKNRRAIAELTNKTATKCSKCFFKACEQV
jgi:hypothetical protein